MSLLNETLKNLEKRKCYDEVGAKNELPGVQAAANGGKRGSSRMYVLVLSSLILCVAVFFFVKEARKYFSIKSVSVQPIRQKVIYLKKVYVAQNQNEVVMQFAFSSPIKYVVNQNADHSVTIISFINANYGNNVEITPIDFIKKVTTKFSNDYFQITAEALPNTEVKVAQYQAQDSFQLIFVFSNNQVAQLAKSEVQKVAVPLSRDEQANVDYQNALNLIAKDNFDEAIFGLKKIVNDVPELLPARRALVVLLMKRDHIDEAASYLATGLKLTPESLDLLELDARLFLLRGNPAQALLVLQKVSPDIAQDPDYYALVASVHQRLGKYDVAAQIYQQLLAINRSNSNWWIGLGLALESQKKTNTALQAYQQALTLGDLSPSLQMSVQEKIARLGK